MFAEEAQCKITLNREFPKKIKSGDHFLMNIISDPVERTEYNNISIVTDPSDSRRKDAIFPICFENRYFADHLAVQEGDEVLDLCTGSGVIALFASQKANKVIGVDINPRAIHLAQHNAKENGLDAKIELHLGDLYEPVKEKAFDLITVNPPFEQTYNGRNFLHSDGGSRGTEITYKVVDGLSSHLRKDGRFQMITWLVEYEYNKLIDRLGILFKNVEAINLREYSKKEMEGYLEKRHKIFNGNISELIVEKTCFTFITASALKKPNSNGFGG